MKPQSLKAILTYLRAPNGCPWDREQTHASLAKYLREETAEVLDAIAKHKANDPKSEKHLCEELGDLYLQVVFHACLAQERGTFDLHDVEAMVVAKLLRRHPHVFDPETSSAVDSQQALLNWQEIKEREKSEDLPQSESAGQAESGLLENMLACLSSMCEAMEIGHRCARVGFDWPDIDGVLDKVKEEIAELQLEIEHDRVEAEFGDVLFSLLQWARHKKIDPDVALRLQMQRFRQRFKYVEERARESGGWRNVGMEEMENAWRMAKSINM